jgi:hypothetical protein
MGACFVNVLRNEGLSVSIISLPSLENLKYINCKCQFCYKKLKYNISRVIYICWFRNLRNIKVGYVIYL